MNLVYVIIAIGFAVALVSFWVIRRAAHRPANGELGTLMCLDAKVSHTARCLRRLKEVPARI